MKKVFIFLLFIASFLNASMLLDKGYPLCIEDYYVKGGALYYLKSSDNSWGSDTSNKLVKEIHYGYDFNSTSGECVPVPYKKELGLSYFQFHFLLALSGLLFSAIVFFMISSFLIGL